MSKQIENLGDYREEAKRRSKNYGKTNKHTTGLPGLDSYLGDGYGNKDGYEIITLFGESGVGKSSVALNMIAREMVKGTKIGLMILEDDMPDVYNRILQILGEQDMAVVNEQRNVEVVPRQMTAKAWKFEDILKWIEDKHVDRGIELFLIDHIQFIFENEENIKGENEIARQRKFLQQLNFLVKRIGITVILISHISKDTGAIGMNKIIGTTSIKQVSTKVIEVAEGDGPYLHIRLWKSRFTRRQYGPWSVKRVGLRIEDHNAS